MDNSSVGAEFPTESIGTVIVVSIGSGTGLIILAVFNLFICGIILTLCRSQRTYEFHSETSDPTLARESQSKDEYPATPLYTAVMPLDFTAAQMNPNTTNRSQHLAEISLESYRVPSNENIYSSISESRDRSPNLEFRVQRNPSGPVAEHSCTELKDDSESVEDGHQLGTGWRLVTPDLTLTQDLVESPVLII